MNNITNEIQTSLKNDVEIFWSYPHSKVLMFVNGTPVSFMSLDSSENTDEKAFEVAKILIKGGGVSLPGF